MRQEQIEERSALEEVELEEVEDLIVCAGQRADQVDSSPTGTRIRPEETHSLDQPGR